MVGEECNPQSRLDGDRDVVHDERLLDRLADAVDDVDRAIGSANIREQHAELVRAEACNRVSHAQGTSQPRFDLTKQLVPVSMSERVVDLLEAVEIADEATDAIAAPSCSEQRLPAPVEIQRAIGQPGQA